MGAEISFLARVVTVCLESKSHKRMPSQNTPQSAQANIETVARLEQEFLEQRTLADRMGDLIVSVVGTPGFVAAHLIAFTVWIFINLGKLSAIPAFDPYPFVLLTMIVSMEGVLLAVFILMKQNRMSRRADQRDHLHLQVNLLAEKEITKMLQMQRQVCEHLGIREAAEDREVEELATNTAVDSLARELHEKLP
jgi:uncharacterized membrane protein